MEFSKNILHPNMTRREALKLLLASAGAATVAACGAERQSKQSTPEKLEAKQPTGEFSDQPTWSQDFSEMPDGRIDAGTWHYELDPAVPGYNDEAQGYTDRSNNVRIENGVLVLQARRESYTYPSDVSGKKYEITSGRIDTRESLNFEYGKIEATIKLPKGAGVWPAFWLLSANQPNTTKLHPTDVDWAQPRFYMKDGELDILEAYGNRPGIIEGTVHTYDKSTEGHVTVPDATEEFHTYGVEITPDKLVWTLDDEPYFTFEKPTDNTDKWPFGNGNQLYVILNLAMGGAAGDIDAADSWQMDVKSINFYDYNK